jgi:uncharacterized protein YecT (DUF1311 family)
VIKRVRLARRRAPLSIAGRVASAVFAAAPTGLAAQEPDCRDPQTQAAMNICAGRDHEAADRALNRAYRELRPALQERGRELGSSLGGIEAALVAGQRGWIAYRDGHCAVAGAEARGGAMEPHLVTTCKAELARHRARELNELLDGTAR